MEQEVAVFPYLVSGEFAIKSFPVQETDKVIVYGRMTVPDDGR